MLKKYNNLVAFFYIFAGYNSKAVSFGFIFSSNSNGDLTDFSKLNVISVIDLFLNKAKLFNSLNLKDFSNEYYSSNNDLFNLKENKKLLVQGTACADCCVDNFSCKAEIAAFKIETFYFYM